MSPEPTIIHELNEHNDGNRSVNDLTLLCNFSVLIQFLLKIVSYLPTFVFRAALSAVLPTDGDEISALPVFSLLSISEKNEKEAYEKTLQSIWQRLSRHLLAETTAYVKMQLLDAVFSLRFVSYQTLNVR